MKTLSVGRSPTICFIRLKPNEAFAEASFSTSLSAAEMSEIAERAQKAVNKRNWVIVFEESRFIIIVRQI
jgi:hypothetical protein